MKKFLMLLLLVLFSLGNTMCGGISPNNTHSSQYGHRPQLDLGYKNLKIILITNNLTSGTRSDIRIKWMSEMVDYSRNKEYLPKIMKKLHTSSKNQLKKELSKHFKSISVKENMPETFNEDVIVLIPSIIKVSSYVDSPYGTPFNDANASIHYNLKIIDNKKNEVEKINASSNVSKKIQSFFGSNLIFGATSLDLVVALFDDINKKACESITTQILSSENMVAFSHNLVQSKTLPANLVLNIKFVDDNSIIPNSMIDAGENSAITVTIKNVGKGTAFNVALQLNSKNKNILYPKKNLLGDIRPGELKKVKIPIKANIDVNKEIISFYIQALENRGFNSNKFRFNINSSKFEKPAIVITSYKLNDDNTGLSSGNGNGIPENGETIELIPYVKNEGVGNAVKVDLT